MAAVATAARPRTTRPIEVQIPYKPRRWASAVHASFKRFMTLVLHRRVGKTTGVINHHQRAAMDDEWERQRLLQLMPHLSPAEVAGLVRPPGGRH